MPILYLSSKTAPTILSRIYYYRMYLVLGGIQQLRGQEEGEGGSAKIPRLSTRVGGSLECPRGLKPSYFIKYFILLCTVMGGKKEIKLHQI